MVGKFMAKSRSQPQCVGCPACLSLQLIKKTTVSNLLGLRSYPQLSYQHCAAFLLTLYSQNASIQTGLQGIHVSVNPGGSPVMDQNPIHRIDVHCRLGRGGVEILFTASCSGNQSYTLTLYTTYSCRPENKLKGFVGCLIVRQALQSRFKYCQCSVLE